MENRENVFTSFARSINNFSAHKINKEQLYKHFVSCIEMCDEIEKLDRKKYEVDMEKWRDSNPSPIDKPPYSNYDKGLELL